jgi:SET domain-containing protein
LGLVDLQQTLLSLYILTYGIDLTMAGGLIIRSSSIHAAGCYTTRAVKKGQRVCEYDGPRFTKDQADERYADREITYLFSCGNAGVVIDGFGIAMFINHSCDPNCESDDVDGRVFIVAIRDIAAGEELTYEYNLYDSDDADGDCYCGAKQCRGTMFSEAEVKRRARKVRALVKTASGR